MSSIGTRRRRGCRRVLQVWVDGRCDGTCWLGTDSVAARAVLKSFDPARSPEFRDLLNQEIWRYDRVRDKLYQFMPMMD